jgi:hypothetical protein
VWELWADFTHTLTLTDAGWKCSGMGLQVAYTRGNEAVRDAADS